MAHVMYAARALGPMQAVVCVDVSPTGPEGTCTVQATLKQAIERPLNMYGPRGAGTSLLDLPDELLSKCLSWYFQVPEDVNFCDDWKLTICKRFLSLYLQGSRQGTLGFKLWTHSDLSAKKKQLQLLSHTYPSLHMLHVRSPKVMLRNDLASLLAAQEGGNQPVASWLKGITHLWLGSTDLDGSMQGVCHVLAHPVSASMASALPFLKVLRLDAIAFDEKQQQQADHDLWQQRRVVNKQFEEVKEDISQQLQQREQILMQDRSASTAAALQQQWQQLQGAVQHLQHLTQQEHLLLQQVPTEAWTDLPVSPASLPHLQQLTLYSCRLCNSATTFQQQLQMLPSLQDLRLIECDFKKQGTQRGYAAAVAASVSGHLTRLEWQYLEGHSMVELLGKPYPQLEQLCVPGTMADDNVMELLLTHTTSLKLLQLAGFQVRRDFSHRTCSWESVTMHSKVDLASFPCLPLRHKPKLCVCAMDCFTVSLAMAQCSATASALQLAAAAAAAVKHCGGIQRTEPGQGGTVWVVVDTCMSTDIEQALLATIPWLSSTRVWSISFTSVHITKPVVGAISSHLPHCGEVQFGDACTFEQGIWGSLISLLPHATSLIVKSEAATLPQLTALCAAANHHVRLRVRKRVGECDDVGAFLRQATQAAGHEYVQVFAWPF